MSFFVQFSDHLKDLKVKKELVKPTAANSITHYVRPTHTKGSKSFSSIQKIDTYTP